MSEDVNSWLARLNPEEVAVVNRLRSIVLAVPAPWQESIKWNAPSFAIGGQDRLTLGLNRKGGYRVVLHSGARGRDRPTGFEDRSGLATWPGPDRGVINLVDLADVEAKAEALARLIAEWIAGDGIA